MPAPLAAILGGVLARGGAAVAARTGAGVAAKGVMAAGTEAAASQAVGGAVVRSGVQGASRAATGAVSHGPVAEGTVVTSRFGNAKDLTEALGKRRRAPKPQGPDVSETGLPQVPRRGINPLKASEAKPLTRHVDPQVSKTRPTVPIKAEAVQPGPAQPKTWGTLVKEKSAQAKKGISNSFQEYAKAMKGERIKQALFPGYNRPQPYQGTFEERAAAMRQSGELLSGKEVTKRTGIKKPGLEHIVNESEQERQRKHDEARSKSVSAIKNTVKGAILLATGPILAPLGAYKMISGLHKFSRGIWEAAKGLAKYNVAIASVAIMEERQRNVQALQMGRGTAGSATRLGKAIISLKDETFEMRRTFTTMGNVLAGNFVKLLTVLMWIANRSPGIIVLNKLAGIAERFINKDRDTMTSAYGEMLKTFKMSGDAPPVRSSRPLFRPGRDPRDAEIEDTLRRLNELGR